MKINGSSSSNASPAKPSVVLVLTVGLIEHPPRLITPHKVPAMRSKGKIAERRARGGAASTGTRLKGFKSALVMQSMIVQCYQL